MGVLSTQSGVQFRELQFKYGSEGRVFDAADAVHSGAPSLVWTFPRPEDDRWL